MSQSRRGSIAEAVVSTCVGLVLAWSLNLILHKQYGIAITTAQNVGLTGWMTVASLIRGYVLRRAFNAQWWKVVLGVALVYAARYRKVRR